MREIITIQVGACGCAVGEAFWNVISNEHGIAPTGGFGGTSSLQFERINVFFNEGHRTFYARAIAVDTDKTSIEKLANGPLGLLFTPTNMLYSSGNSGTGNCFAKGFYTEGKEMLEPLLNSIRHEAENTDALQGLQIIHSMGGGTGSGLTALLLQNLVDEYPENIIQTISVIPSPKLSDSVVEPYNAVLTIPHLITNTHLTFCMDNDSLHDICIERLGLPRASYQNTNHIIAMTMSGITTCLRFPGQLNSGLRKLFVNMCPFPKLHFLVPGFAPLSSSQRVQYEKLSVPELVTQIFNSKNLLADIDLRQGKMLAVAAIFRGRMSPKEVDTLMINTRNKNAEYFVNWIPNNIKTAICDVPPMGLKMSSTFIGNTTGIVRLFRRVQKSFRAMLQKKAFLHWYTSEGMDECEFKDADNRLDLLLQEYLQYGQDIPVEDSNSSICFQCKHRKNNCA